MADDTAVDAGVPGTVGVVGVYGADPETPATVVVGAVGVRGDGAGGAKVSTTVEAAERLGWETLGVEDCDEEA